MPFSYPLLVESLIDWYRWQIKWREVNKMYHNEYTYSNMCISSNWMQYNYRTLSYDHYITIFNYIFNHKNIYKNGPMLKCPSKYRYSSGMNHPFGYKGNKNID